MVTTSVMMVMMNGGGGGENCCLVGKKTMSWVSSVVDPHLHACVRAWGSLGSLGSTVVVSSAAHLRRPVQTQAGVCLGVHGEWRGTDFQPKMRTSHMANPGGHVWHRGCDFWIRDTPPPGSQQDHSTKRVHVCVCIKSESSREPEIDTGIKDIHLAERQQQQQQDRLKATDDSGTSSIWARVVPQSKCTETASTPLSLLLTSPQRPFEKHRSYRMCISQMGGQNAVGLWHMIQATNCNYPSEVNTPKPQPRHNYHRRLCRVGCICMCT
jgi:hypothetical protein